MALPKHFGEDELHLCPADPYLDAIKMREATFEQMHKAIKGKNLTPEQQRMLHVAIQGYFREWFVQRPQYKQITEMLKVMDQEF